MTARHTVFLGSKLAIVLLAVMLHFTRALALSPDPLPSWNAGEAKQNIVAFVASSTQDKWGTFIPPERRVAVFDNDGTLWSEQPVYVQLRFALDRIKALAPQHPEWKTEQPFAAVLADDMKGVMASGKPGLARIIAVTHTGMTPGQYMASVSDWLKQARHPDCRCAYTSLVYQPMLELMTYLRANGFKTYIVSGGTVDFMRVFAQKVYGIPPEQVIGSAFATALQTSPQGQPQLMRQPKLDVMDDGPGKPASIERIIGRRPVLAFGNSDGDLQMLEWTAAGSGPRLLGLVHHTDAAREYAYDRASRIGTLDKALDEAKAKGWVVVDMRKDWRVVFPSGVTLAFRDH